MIAQVALICLLSVVSARPQYGAAPGYAVPVAEHVYEEVPQPYTFGFNTKDEYGATINQQETGDESGNKKGSYGYTDPNGTYRQVDYVADAHGFRATIKTNEPGTDNKNPADTEIYSDAAPVNYDAHVAYEKPTAYVAPVYAKPAAAVYTPAPVSHIAAPVYGAASVSHSATPVYGAVPVSHATAYTSAPASHVDASVYNAAPVSHIDNTVYGAVPISHATAYTSAPASHVDASVYNAAPVSHVDNTVYAPVSQVDTSLYGAAPVTHVDNTIYGQAPVEHVDTSVYGAAPVNYVDSSLYSLTPVSHVSGPVYDAAPVSYGADSVYDSSPVYHGSVQAHSAVQVPVYEQVQAPIYSGPSYEQLAGNAGQSGGHSSVPEHTSYEHQAINSHAPY